MTASHVKPLLLAVFGVLSIGIGIGTYLGIPLIVYKVIYSQLQLRENTQAYEIWKDLPVPIYQEFYFFNVTNPTAIERGAKPILKEFGPFTYRSYFKKHPVVENANQTVSYREVKTYVFRRDLSIADDTAIVTTLNAPLALTLTLLQSAPSAVRIIVSLALDGLSEGFFVKRTIRQLLFEGYPDILVTFAPLLNPEIPPTNGRFAYLYNKNNTDDGLFNVYTGQGNISKLNYIDRLNGKPNLNYWTTRQCNSFKGSTNAEIYPPLQPNHEYIKIFNVDFCRAMKLDFNETIESLGLHAKRFILDRNTYKNATDYLPNACFKSKIPRRSSIFNAIRNPNSNRSSNGGSTGTIFPSGTFDMSGCKFGVPLLMSNPHFYDADPYYLSTVEGLSPNASRHDFMLDLEPITGTTLRLMARLQFNIAISKPPTLFRYRNIPEIVFPIFWQNLDFELTEDLAKHVGWAIRQPVFISSISLYSLLSIGLIFLTSVIAIYVYRYKKNDKNIVSIDDSMENNNKDDKEQLNRRQSDESSEGGIDNPVAPSDDTL